MARTNDSSIFMITMLQRNQERCFAGGEPTGIGEFGDMHFVGFCNKEEDIAEALDNIESNIDGIKYNYALVEEIAPGIRTDVTPLSRSLFRVEGTSPENSFVPEELPDFLNDMYGIALG